MKKLLLSLLKATFRAAKVAFVMTLQIVIIALKVFAILFAIAISIGLRIPLPGIDSSKNDRLF